MEHPPTTTFMGGSKPEVTVDDEMKGDVFQMTDAFYQQVLGLEDTVSVLKSMKLSECDGGEVSVSEEVGADGEASAGGHDEI